MKLTSNEIDFLAAWAREEWEPACYRLHAHQLQLAHGVSGASFITLIKAWTKAEKKKDRDILDASGNSTPSWPWGSNEAFRARLEEASL
ncbi:MAG TPA: hypothetical protein VFE62_00720 [Gemmataceae bacterium]|nr:hypothetical protein [Gemmataceae bacterium]